MNFDKARYEKLFSKDATKLIMLFTIDSDRHYPGIKSIVFEPYNADFYNIIGWDSVCDIFQIEKNKGIMRGISRYLMSNCNVLDDLVDTNLELGAQSV